MLIREDGSYLYTLPSVVDDIDLEITHIIRGEDHVTNTGVQLQLFEALAPDRPAPEFAHHNLLISGEGEGLSKRTGALSIASLREDRSDALGIRLTRHHKVEMPGNAGEPICRSARLDPQPGARRTDPRA